MSKEKPIALEAYEKLADGFSAIAETKVENAHIEQPAMRAMIGDVRGLKILEAGCGPGILAKYLVSRGASKVVGFDLTPKMIEHARARLGSQAELHVADLSGPLEFAADQSFDLVTSSLAIDYVRDWDLPLGEFRRVLKPGGRLVFSVLHPQGSYDWYRPPSPFGIHPAQAVWTEFGAEPVVVPDYYRSISEIIKPLPKNGFRISRLVECQPTEALKETDPAAYDRFQNRPTFMVIEALIES